MNTPAGIPSPSLPAPGSPAISSGLRAYQNAQHMLANSAERLATGLGINRGSDDPAGLIASEVIRADVARIDAEMRGYERANMRLSVKAGVRQEMGALLRERDAIAVRAANTGAMTDAERDALAVEAAGIEQSLRRMSDARFGGEPVFDTDEVDIDASDAAVANAVARGEIGTRMRENEAMARVKAKEIESLTAAGSVIRDTDSARESSEFIRARVQADAGVVVLNAANQNARTVLDLLGGSDD